MTVDILPKIVHISEDFSPTGGGVFSAHRELISHLAGYGIDQTLITTGPVPTALPIDLSAHHLVMPWWGHPWRYSPGLSGLVREHLQIEPRVLHLHGVWMAPQLIGAKIARELGSPVILSPHNMLGGWFWNQGRVRNFKKSLYWNLAAKQEFQHVMVIHALTPHEAETLAEFFPSQRIAIIPNAIDLAKVDAEVGRADNSELDPQHKDFLLFMGRLHPVKGVELLIEAYARLRSHALPPLLIAGPPDSPGYLTTLKAQVRAKNLEDRIVFLGAVKGERKWALYRQARAVCAPSYSEGMSMVALEAMAAGSPVITTHEAGIHDIPAGGGELIHPSVSEVADALAKTLAWGRAERLERGYAARSLVENRYSWEIVGNQWIELYRNLVR